MKIHFEIEYWTAWGESLWLVRDGSSKEMKFFPGGVWACEEEIRRPGSEISYTYEVRRGEEVVAKEWRGHKVRIPEEVKNLEVRDRWFDMPENSPFYSKFFKSVIFRRAASRPQEAEGNVTIEFYSPEIRPDQTVAITGGGKHFKNWTKFIALDDSEFPLWKISLRVTEPFEYKFVIAGRRDLAPLMWESGENRFCADVPAEGSALVLADQTPVFPILPWRGAGTAVPVFSLRTSDSFGVGEFLDIKALVDWAAACGQNVIQLLPVNDTTMTGTWKDSYPYNANSIFALHPQFINLPAAGCRADARYKAMRDELNALPKEDYERVNKAKTDLLRKTYRTEKVKALLASDAYKAFMKSEEAWLLPYAVFCCLRDENKTCETARWGRWAKYSAAKVKEYAASHPDEVGFWCWEQFEADRQLKEAVDYAHKHGVALKGDIPIGVSRTSADAWQHPELFHLDSQAGAPPDAFSVNGQNWGFPTYDWDKMSQDGFLWWKQRLSKMSEYFDAFRIDHILGFFRIWEIPMDAVHGLLGHFNPALPYSAGELRNLGFDPDFCSKPFAADWALAEIFGDLLSEVQSRYVVGGKIAEDLDTQKKIAEKFSAAEPGSSEERLRDGLMGLLDDVLFVEDPRRPGWYHPRIAGQQTLSYRALEQWRKDAYNRLYNDFFFRRHNDFWRASALRKLPALLGSTEMLACGEDLGMIPACVPEVMKELRILSLEIQRMPKSPDEEFANPDWYPYLCVCATGTHDTSSLRAWWEEDRRSTEDFYHKMLGQSGEAPLFCEPWICEKIIRAHAKSPAMLAILPLQDWLSIDGAVRWQGDPKEERINVPAIPRYYWRYRIHLPLDGKEGLDSKEELKGRLRGILGDYGRGV